MGGPAPVRVELRGRWGCGCDMAACDVFEYTAARGLPDHGCEDIGRVLRCRTHDLTAYAVIGVACSSMEGADLEAMRRMSLMHEEQCR